MRNRYRVGVGTSGGSGFSLGPVQNEFTDNAARDAYATANAAWLALYNGDRSFWIRVGGAAGTVQRRNAAGTDWENVTGIISGPAGADSTVPGPAGQGVPAAGVVGDIMQKTGVADYATGWLTPGIQTYLGSGVSWDDESDPTELRLSQYFGADGGATIFGSLAKILFRIPAVTPRGATELTARVVTGSGTDSGLIVRDLRDRRILARDLVPNGLYLALYATGSPGSLRLVEPLPVRPQDFDIVASWLPQPPFDQAAFEAYVSDAANHATSDTSSITQVAPADYATRTSRSVSRAIGLPLDAPDIAVIQPTRGGQVGFTHIGPWDGREFQGTPLKWFNMGPVPVADFFADYTITYMIEFAPYA